MKTDYNYTHILIIVLQFISMYTIYKIDTTYYLNNKNKCISVFKINMI